MKLTGHKAIKNELGDADLPAMLCDGRFEGDLLPQASVPRKPSTRVVAAKSNLQMKRGRRRVIPMKMEPADKMVASSTSLAHHVRNRREKMAKRNKSDQSNLVINDDFGTSPLVHGHHEFGRGHFSTSALRDLAARLKIHPVVVLLEFATGWVTDVVVDKETGEVKVAKRPVTDDLRLLGAKEAAKYLSPQLKSVEIREGSKEQQDLANVMKLAHAHAAASPLQPGEEVVVIQGDNRTVVHTGTMKMIDDGLPPGEIPRELQEGTDDDEDEPAGDVTP